MQPWQIKSLGWEASALDHLTEYISEHALYFFMGAIYLLLALLVWVLSGGLRRKGNPTCHVRPTIVVYQTQSPPPPQEPPFNPFPPLRETSEYGHDEDWD